MDNSYMYIGAAVKFSSVSIRRSSPSSTSIIDFNTATEFTLCTDEEVEYIQSMLPASWIANMVWDVNIYKVPIR